MSRIRIVFIFIVMLCVSCMYSEQHKKEDYSIHAEVDNVALDSIKIINRIYEDEGLQGLISFNDSNEIKCKIEEFMPNIWVVKMMHNKGLIYCDAVIEKKEDYDVLDLQVYEK